MITDLRDTLLSIGAATALVALGGLALGSSPILTFGLQATGVVILGYAVVAAGIAGANIVAMAKAVTKKAVNHGRR